MDSRLQGAFARRAKETGFKGSSGLWSGGLFRDESSSRQFYVNAAMADSPAQEAAVHFLVSAVT